MIREEAINYLKCIVGDKSTDFVMQPIKTEVLVVAIDALEKIQKIDGIISEWQGDVGISDRMSFRKIKDVMQEGE